MSVVKDFAKSCISMFKGLNRFHICMYVRVVIIFSTAHIVWYPEGGRENCVALLNSAWLQLQLTNSECTHTHTHWPRGCHPFKDFISSVTPVMLVPGLRIQLVPRDLPPPRSPLVHLALRNALSANHGALLLVSLPSPAVWNVLFRGGTQTLLWKICFSKIPTFGMNCQIPLLLFAVSALLYGCQGHPRTIYATGCQVFVLRQ